MMSTENGSRSAPVHAVVIRLPENAPALLRALNSEFYGGKLAHADAFRILPLIAEAIEKDDGEAWPLRDVLAKLTEAAETLMSQYSYDGHGYEEITECVRRAKEMLAV